MTAIPPKPTIPNTEPVPLYSATWQAADLFLQCLAADLAGVQLVFHACPSDRMGEIRLAISLTLDLIRDNEGSWPSAIDSLAQMRFPWGRQGFFI